jgi:hypothetical protein
LTSSERAQKPAAGKCSGVNGFSEPIRQRIRHKHLSEQDYAFEKIFRRRNSR